MNLSLVRPLATFLLLFTIPILTTKAQKVKSNSGPEEQSRKIKPEIKKAFINWANDVALILTPAERAAWDKLQTDDEREKFIAIFWDQRDPDPDTEENEYKEEFYERLAYVDEHFSSGKPGRMTDRGRIYIKFGKPDEIESHPAGGQYERPAYEGGGSTSTYPFEKWFYRNIPNVGTGVDIEFVDPTGSGEYRLARNPDEKDAMLYVPGAGPTIAERLGFQSRADRIAGSGGFGRVNYQRQQDSPFEVQELLMRLDEPIPIKRSSFDTITSTPAVDERPLNFEVQIDHFRQTDNQVLTALTLQTDNSELVFKDRGGIQTAHLNIFGRITSISGRRLGAFEDPVVTTATAEELSELKARKSAYAKAIILPPGRYRVDLSVRDIESGATGIQHIGFEVPKFPSDQLAVSSLILAAKLERRESQSTTDFVIGTTKVIPNISGVYARMQPIGIYLQIYNAAVDQTTLRPAVDVEYVLLKGGKDLVKHFEDWRNINDRGQRLTLTHLFDTRALTPGDYQIQVRIHDRITGQALSPVAKFTIAP
jgi:GWxTD domain-containing protein